MNKLIFTWKTIYGHILMKSFVTRANNISINRGTANGFTQGVEIFYTDPTPIGNGGAQFTCYSIVLTIDRTKSVTNLEFMKGNKQDILYSINNRKLNLVNATIMMVPTPELQTEFVTNLSIEEKSANGDMAKMQLFSELRRFYNTGNSYNAPANPLDTFGAIIDNDLQVTLLSMNQILTSLNMDRAQFMLYVNDNVIDIDDGILADGQILFSSGIVIQPLLLQAPNGQPAWEFQILPGYTLMRAVKDDSRFSVFNL